MAYLNLHDLEPLAREKLPPPIFDFIAGGAEDETTLRANRAAFEAIEFRPRVLVDVANIDTSTTVIGRTLPFPVMLAPVAFHRLADPEGEAATAKAAAQAGTVMILSTMSSLPLEDVAAAAPGPKWFQLYCYGDRSVTERLVGRAEEAGFEALCLTVDVPRLGRRERDFRHPLAFPDDIMPVNFLQEFDLASMPDDRRGMALSAFVASLMDQTLTWESVDWLRSITRMPVLVKGVLTPEDALLAVEHGVAGIVVSNHGGRQLDGSPPGIRVLAEIADVVSAARHGRGEGAGAGRQGGADRPAVHLGPGHRRR
jgi:isopentenyl diphosphate isomerase/L-lactate dehydrogenase-like FMN-dependent dehydrogenase